MSSRLMKVLVTRRRDSCWANRHDKMEFYGEDGQIVVTDYVVIPDDVILCDLCNANFPEDPETEIPILQESDDGGYSWVDLGTRCPECLEREEKARGEQFMRYSLS